jgi:hypothetical protein
MTDENRIEQSSAPDQPLEDTGQLDVRYALWRKFCAGNAVAIDTLPSDLSDEQKEIWERLKEEDLLKTDPP